MGATRRARLKADWDRAANPLTAILGDSGTQKSPAHQVATNPLGAAGNPKRFGLIRIGSPCTTWRSSGTRRHFRSGDTKG